MTLNKILAILIKKVKGDWAFSLTPLRELNKPAFQGGQRECLGLPEIYPSSVVSSCTSWNTWLSLWGLKANSKLQWSSINSQIKKKTFYRENTYFCKQLKQHSLVFYVLHSGNGPSGGALVKSLLPIPAYLLLHPWYELCSFCLTQILLKLATTQKLKELQTQQDHVNH